ncbi:DUF4199 domain-containing protein [Mongoliitalea daihaiensis]|uniref:DUF4199 domain-containing protein n=1 Tax=Mongoliitalea daihaiensis TaxID=2782006 RepID=UPI001F195395|nr:DUF4199 domain-containing protein [Mongoliitalea daihaiensis]UJP66624.1 DUF4199 domain-containing protein [Mongoliitalea daihaiensis]
MNRYLESTYKFALIGGGFCLIAFILFGSVGYDAANFSMLLGYIITPVFLFIGIRLFKKGYNQGFLSFAHGMTVGFLIYMGIALVSGLGILVFLLLNPEAFEALKALKLQVLEVNEEMIKSQVGEESFAITLVNVQNMKPLDIAINDFLWKIVPGLFFTIIISIILRKNKI